MEKSYELLKEPNSLFFRIRALIDIPHWGVKKGDIGGLVENEDCLSQKGLSWIDKTSQVEKNVRVGDWVFIGNKTCIGGKLAIQNTKIRHSSVDMDGNLNGCTIENSKLYDEVEVNGNIIVIDSEIREGKVRGKGYVQNSKMENVILDGTFNVESSTVVGDNETTVVVNGKDMRIQGSHIRGSVQMEGNLSMTASDIQDSVSIKMTGTIDKCELSEFATINEPLGRPQALTNLKLDGDTIYSPPF